MFSPKQVLKRYALATLLFALTVALINADSPLLAMIPGVLCIVIAVLTLRGAIG